MKIEEIRNELLGDVVYSIKHDSGLTILVMPKPGYSSAYAVFATKYGSIDTSVKNGNGGFDPIPEGTAHFLEHKLFECEDLDAFERFSKTGASANAYTSFDRTAYLFSCSQNFEDSLEVLIDFVQKPYFTQQTVEKEQGIIGQEIRMYKDSADWEVMFNLLTALYSDHPVRIDIAGTQDSIAQISADLLYQLYRNFYNLNNMVLSVCGNVDVDTVLRVVDKTLIPAPGVPVERNFIRESPVPCKKYIEESLDVAQKQFLLGFKEDIDTPERTLEEETATEIMLDTLFSKSSKLYNSLLRQELIDMSFSTEYFDGFGYACVLMGGTSKDPQKVSEILINAIEEAKKTGIDPADYERARRRLYGRTVMSYNSVEGIANIMMGLHFSDNKPFSELECFKNITIDTVNERLKKLSADYSALSVINPRS